MPRPNCCSRVLLASCVACVLIACGAPPREPQLASGAAPPASESTDSGTVPSSPGVTVAPAAPSTPPPPLPGGEAPTPDKALPEVKVESTGLHVGGGTNTPEEKAPFHEAVRRQFPEFLRCYRLAEQPERGGTFGVDLRIPREGGRPVVVEPARSRVRGQAFEQCMVKAFGAVEFVRPKAGPTVISYAVAFSLGK